MCTETKHNNTIIRLYWSSSFAGPCTSLTDLLTPVCSTGDPLVCPFLFTLYPVNPFSIWREEVEVLSDYRHNNWTKNTKATDPAVRSEETQVLQQYRAVDVLWACGCRVIFYAVVCWVLYMIITHCCWFVDFGAFQPVNSCISLIHISFPSHSEIWNAPQDEPS